jgi:hypothetical protein
MLTHSGLIYNELISVGLNISGCDSSGNVSISSRPTCPEGQEETWTDPTDSLVALCLAAHGQPLSSDECLALQAAITEEQWLAYTEARKAPVKAKRAERYKNECDPVYLKITEDALKANTTPDYTEWLQLKDAIRNDLPYSE